MALALLLLVSSLSAAAAERRFVVDAASAGLDPGVSLEGLAVPLRLHAGNFEFAESKADGSDLEALVAGTRVPLRIERWDPANELGVVWVALPPLSAEQRQIEIVVRSGASTVSEARAPLYDPEQVAVLSFEEGVPLARDATGNGNDATSSVELQPAGLLGAAAMANGEPLIIKASESLRLVAGGGFTYAAWLKADDVGQVATLYQQGDAASGVSLRLEGGQLVLSAGAADRSIVTSTAEMQSGVWHHIAATIDAQKAILFLDGRETATAVTSLPAVASDVRIGEGFRGLLDEIELSDVARPPAWIEATMLAQSFDGAFVRAAPDVATETESGSYFGILFANLTPDAWVVIVLLGVMLLVAVTVMLRKILLLSRVQDADEAFLAAYEAGDPLRQDLQASARFPDSALSALYRSGLREYTKEAGRSGSAARGEISARAMQVVRAAVDAEKIRQGRRLNSHIVLLTIAISGGPFVGLLGTVMGVMITFASIAAAGDVNINAIAPGIAAALLATVAGLAVAIPSLFGYNWLAVQIQEMRDEMDIFVDDLIARIGNVETER